MCRVRVSKGNSTVKGAEFSSRYYTKVRVLGVKITLLEKSGKSTGSGFLSYRKVPVLAVSTVVDCIRVCSATKI